MSNTKQVYFSQGNLQYQAYTNIWRFAEHQYDCVGEENTNISSYYNGWIDLFGWGTSGYNHGAVCYQPWSISTNSMDYLAYGYDSYDLNSASGQADWGYNSIINGGNLENQWHTLTKDEWIYIFNVRNTPSTIRYAKAQVNNINGIILLPDNWSNSYYDLNNTNISNANFFSNLISETDWINCLEVYGAVFLPTAGLRADGASSLFTDFGDYWSASNYESEFAYYINIQAGGLYIDGSNYKHHGRSVRLVHDAN